MNLRHGFGLLLLSASERLRLLSELLIGKVTSTEETKGTLIWGVVDGPYARSDFFEEDLEEFEIEPSFQFMLVCKIEEDGKIGIANFWYETLDEALKVKGHFDKHIEPLEVLQ